MSMIHDRVHAEMAWYDRRAEGGLTRYTRAEVEAAYADLKAADAELDAAAAEAGTVLAPHYVDMGLWREIPDERYHKLEALLLTNLRWAQGGDFKHGSTEAYPLTQWAKAASGWRGLAARIRREMARLERAGR